MEMTVDYNVVTELAGHQKNKGVSLAEATKDIFARVKNQGQQVAVNGTFRLFDTLEQLETILIEAVTNKKNVSVFDEDHAG